MAEVTAKRSVAKEVQTKVEAKECLICSCAVNGPRGLCSAHYQQFYRSLRAVPKRDRAAFEEEQIREGRVLASGYVGELNRPNPFKSEKAESA